MPSQSDQDRRGDFETQANYRSIGLGFAPRPNVQMPYQPHRGARDNSQRQVQAEGSSRCLAAQLKLPSEEASRHGRQRGNGRGNQVVIRSCSKNTVFLPSGHHIECRATDEERDREMDEHHVLRVPGEERLPLCRKDSHGT